MLHKNRVKKGEQVPVEMKLFKGKPTVNVEAFNDSNFNDYLKMETFTFLMSGDMMMIAKWDGEKWICD
jgi:hypothetical protein